MRVGDVEISSEVLVVEPFWAAKRLWTLLGEVMRGDSVSGAFALAVLTVAYCGSYDMPEDDFVQLFRTFVERRRLHPEQFPAKASLDTAIRRFGTPQQPGESQLYEVVATEADYNVCLAALNALITAPDVRACAPEALEAAELFHSAAGAIEMGLSEEQFAGVARLSYRRAAAPDDEEAEAVMSDPGPKV